MSKAEEGGSGSDSGSGSAFGCDGDSGAGPLSLTSPLPMECTTETTGYFQQSDTKVGHMQGPGALATEPTLLAYLRLLLSGLIDRAVTFHETLPGRLQFVE